jgi:hypothetical protein
MMMSSKCFPHMSKMQILKYNWLSSIVTGWVALLQRMMNRNLELYA